METSQNLILGELSSAEFELLRPNLRTIKLPLGLILVHAGDVPERAYFPHSGVISSRITLSNGHAVETRITGREGALGVPLGAGERPSFTSAIVRIAGEASTIEHRNLKTVLEKSTALRVLLTRYDVLQQAMADQSVACNAIHDVKARLACRLLRLRNMSGQTRLTVTQEVLAEMLGIRRNAVSLVAHAMKEARLIRYSRGTLEIIDAEGLQHVACECYNAVTSYRDFLERG